MSNKPRECVDCNSENVEWRPIPDPRFCDSYEVSNRGEVRSVDRVVIDKLGRSKRIRGRSIFRSVCKFGYHRYTLNYGGRRVRQSVSSHRMVALAFIGPPPTSRHEVMHLDHNPGHNHVSNLQWGTHAENVRATNAAGRGVNANARKTHCPQGHEYTTRNLRGDRVCGTCARERQAGYDAKRRRSA